MLNPSSMILKYLQGPPQGKSLSHNIKMEGANLKQPIGSYGKK